MKVRLNSRLSKYSAIIVCALIAVAVPTVAMIDLNENGISDIWEILHPDAGGPNGDPDGDGITNREEAIWGTHPLKADRRAHGLSVALNPKTDELEISWPSVPGKLYQLQTCTNLASGQWVNDGEAVTGTGSTIIVSRPPSSIGRMYRLRADDQASGIEDVTEWEAIAIKLKPNPNLSSASPASFAGRIIGDPSNTVTVIASKPIIYEGVGESGQFTITRSGGGTNSMMVGYSISGTAAKGGTDHYLSSGWVNIPAGSNSVTVNVTPRDDTTVESSESCTIILTWVLRVDPDGLTSIPAGSPNKATVIINNSTTPTGSGLLGVYYDTASTTYTNSANFDPAQAKWTNVDATINFDWGFGTPNGTTNVPADNYSVAWEGYLSPSSPGSYTFQLDADDKARVFFDPADGNGYRQILENGWDTPALGTFKIGSSYALQIPADATARYRMRVEFVETTSNATCRLQWRTSDTSAFANIPTANVFVTNVVGSNATGWVASYYLNTNLSGTPIRVQTDSAITSGNNGIWGTGSPHPSIAADTFSVRWTGQVQPQFTEEYTFVLNADDAVKLWINGQPQTLLMASTANASGTYGYNSNTGIAIITNSSMPLNSFVAGEIARVDPSSGTLSALGYSNYTIISTTSNTFTIAVDASGISPFPTNGTGSCNIEWVNKPVDWPSSTTVDRYARVSLVAGVRYDIRVDYFENTGSAKCQLSWYSPSQPRQIIPSERLYPANGISTSTNAPAPPMFTGATEATALVLSPFSFPITANNGATVTVSGLPAWLSFNGAALTGVPPVGSAGDYQILINLASSAGTGVSALNLHVIDTSRSIVHEYWSGYAGTNVISVPTNTPSGTNILTSLEVTNNIGDDYIARVRGFLHPPVTGNYYFWIAASNSAELWISNDDEPVNAFKRAWVSRGTGSRDWNNPNEVGQKSPWLALESGKKYYIEIIHKGGTGNADNLAVGWLPPSQSGNAPSEVVPGYVLSPYVAPAASTNSGTLYIATMLSQNGANTDGVGTSTFRLSEDETYATIKFSYSGLTGVLTDWHVHNDSFLNFGSSIMYDPNAPPPNSGPQPDGSHKWTFPAMVGSMTKAQVIELIKQGKAYINLHTALYPAGEIRGNYTLAGGSRTFSPPPAPPAWTDDSGTVAGAVRFLTQATFGANPADIAALTNIVPSGGKTRYELWIEDQFTKTPSLQLPEVLTNELSDANGGAQFDETLTFNAWWRNSISGPDQLRQRIAFALSHIHVVSADGPLDNRADALSHFYDTFVTNVFGNFRSILESTTLTPAMGRYLDMLRNDKPDVSIGRIPNENYAREIKQLFSVGLYRMWPDGTLILNSKDQPIDTYTQREIIGFAHVFTGWDSGYDGAFRTSFSGSTDWTRPMREVPARHFTGPKRLLNNEVLPGLSTLGGIPLDPYATHTAAHFNDPAYQALPAQELAFAHDQLFNHPNVGPFICRQLIQRLVTSHPSRDYIYRVVQAFNDNGAGVRGDMKAVIKAILLDYEARSPVVAATSAFGKQREPVLRVAALARAFRTEGTNGTYNQPAGSHVINITMPNKFAAGNRVYLDFPRPGGAFTPGEVTPTSEEYTVLTSPAPTPTSFSVNARGWTGISSSDGVTSNGVTGTYTNIAGSSVMTITISGHWLPAGGIAYLDFTAATTGTKPNSAVYTAITSDSTDSAGGTSFTVAAPDTTARTGRVRMVRFQGSFTVSNSGIASPNEKRITLDTTSSSTIADHHLQSGDGVYLNFTVGNPKPLDGQFTVESAPDANTFTVLTNTAGTGGGNDGDNGMWIFPLTSQPTGRSGNVSSRPSTFKMGNTDSDMNQTPLNSPTVFNFFLPDYKFPGSLAAQGLTTPEFQLTAETSVIRQGNFIFNGIFSSANTNGIASFKSGSHAIVMDFAPWMQNATNAVLGSGADITKPWTDDVNLGPLVDQLSLLLMGSTLGATNKAVITNFVYQRTISSIALGNPCTITTATPHGLTSSNLVVISGVTGGTFSPTINGSYTNTVTGPNTFTVPVNYSSSASINLASARVGYLAYTNGGTATDAQERDRLRSIIHFILSSPEFLIQR